MTINPPTYVLPPVTKEPLEYANLPIIDLSKAKTQDGKNKLAVELCDAMKTYGLFYIINHGYMQEETNKMFSLARIAFDDVSDEEKLKYTAKSDDEYDGYKPRKTWHIDQGVRDQVEYYTSKRQITNQRHPEALHPFIPLMQEFSKHNFFNILDPILRLLAIGLELPEDTLVKQHQWDRKGFTNLLFTKYHPRTKEEDEKVKNVWLKGHTDLGSVTILWSQPVSGLQVMSPDNKWRYVRHMDNTVLVNTGDVLNFLCGGYYPPTRHRVVRPPEDQISTPRYGVIMFTMPDDDVKLVPYAQSPVLQRVGIQRLCPDEQAPTMEEWRRGRTRSYGKGELRMGKGGVEEEIVNGVVVKHYN